MKMMNKMLPCLKCSCPKTEAINKCYMDYTVCECELVCANCKKTVNYWAYGYYQDPNTLKELIGWKGFSVGLRFKLVLISLYWIIKNKRRSK